MLSCVGSSDCDEIKPEEKMPVESCCMALFFPEAFPKGRP
jgi:hypothetical protein